MESMIEERKLARRVADELGVGEDSSVAGALGAGEYSLAIAHACSIASDRLLVGSRGLLEELARFATQCELDDPDDDDAHDIRRYLALMGVKAA